MQCIFGGGMLPPNPKGVDKAFDKEVRDSVAYGQILHVTSGQGANLTQDHHGQEGNNACLTRCPSC